MSVCRDAHRRDVNLNSVREGVPGRNIGHVPSTFPVDSRLTSLAVTRRLSPIITGFHGNVYYIAEEIYVRVRATGRPCAFCVMAVPMGFIFSR